MLRLELRPSAAALAVVVLVAAGCNRPARRNDWRSPSHTDPSRRPAPPAPSAPCTTDADCAASQGSGACAIELGAAEGTCTTVTPPLRDDGAPRHAPAQPGAPNVQPSPNDIHL